MGVIEQRQYSNKNTRILITRRNTRCT